MLQDYSVLEFVRREFDVMVPEKDWTIKRSTHRSTIYVMIYNCKDTGYRCASKLTGLLGLLVINAEPPESICCIVVSERTHLPKEELLRYC